MSRSLVIFCIACFVLSCVAQPTTPYIAEVFVGKCFERNPTGVNCTTLWNEFSAAAMMSNNVVNDTYYEPFFELTDFSTKPNEILFWVGNQAFALAISNQGGGPLTTVEETSTGYILNGLSWCGVENANPPQFDYVDNCGYLSNSTYYGTQGVWKQCSQRFASGATGHATVLMQPARLNYNSGPYMAYRNTSVFYQIELPSINASRITGFTILLIANKTEAPEEVCGSGSLVELAKNITDRFGFEPECIDDPKKIYDLLCPDSSTQTAQCLAATLAYSETTCSESKERSYLIWALATSVLAVAFFVLFIYYVIRSSKRQGYDPITMGK